MGEVIRNYKKTNEVITFKDIDKLDEGYFKNNISFLYIPNKELTENWNEYDWDNWFKENDKRIYSSIISFDNRVKTISKGSFENWSAEKLEFKNGIDIIEEEGIFGGNVRYITIDKGIKKIGNGNFSNMLRKDKIIKTDKNGLELVINGDIGLIQEGVFSDSIYKSIRFNGSIGRIEDYHNYLVPSFSNLKIYSLNIPEGMKDLGYGNFNNSQFGYLTLPSTLSTMDESIFLDSLVDILVVHNMDLDFESRNILYPYKRMVLDAKSKPIIIGHKGSQIEDYALRKDYDFQEIIYLNEEVYKIDENIYRRNYELFLNEIISEYEDDYKLEYDLLISKDVEESNIINIKYRKSDKIDIELEEGRLNIYLKNGYSFKNHNFELSLKYKQD